MRHNYGFQPVSNEVDSKEENDASVFRTGKITYSTTQKLSPRLDSGTRGRGAPSPTVSTYSSVLTLSIRDDLGESELEATRGVVSSG
ncbi:hypothetical protein J6590_071489 [Homalodisca vitripennis]|nr:hypothetical protein J6590_071489 [Homalodisca vitripennis]